jgi:hypothetical protein
MKKLLHNADLFVLAGGSVAMLLQLWIRWGGTDDRNLYPAAHPGWILSWILTVVMAAAIFLMVRHAGDQRSYRSNFSASLPAAIGCVIAAVALLLTGIRLVRSSVMLLDTLSGLAGALGGIALMAAAVYRYRGKRPHSFCYMLPCVFWGLYVFYIGRELGGEPEPVRYLFHFLATLSLIPAIYQLWGFSVASGDRKKCLFWCLLSAYLCILSAPVSENGVMYMSMGLFLLTNLCALKLPIRRIRPTAQPEMTEIADEAPISEPEIPPTMAESFTPATADPQVSAEAPVEAVPELDADAIIAEILKEIDSNIP